MPIGQLRWSPSPIATAGSLSAGQSVPVTVTAVTAAGRPDPGALIFVSFSPAAAYGDNATATCGGKSLPGYCTADANGAVHVRA